MDAEVKSDDGIRSHGTILIANSRQWDLDRRPPAVERAEEKNNLYFHDAPNGIGASGYAKIATWSATGAPDREECAAKLSGMPPSEANILIAPKVDDLFCVHTRDKKTNSTHYAYGEVEDVRPGEYTVKIVVWTNP